MNIQSKRLVKAAPVSPIAFAPQGLLQRKCDCGGAPGLAGECAECSKKRLTVQRKSGNQAEPSDVPPAVHEVLRSSGQPLDPETRASMEQGFGHNLSQVRLHAETAPVQGRLAMSAPEDRCEKEADRVADRVLRDPMNDDVAKSGAAIPHNFGSVRVHIDHEAASSARAIGALAYTVGRHIAFDTGRYAPNTTDGKRLLAHELAHIVQQSQPAFGQENIRGGAALTEATGGAVQRTPSNEAPSAPDRLPDPEVAPEEQSEIDTGTASMRSNITGFFSLIQKVKQKRIDAWEKNAKVEERDPLRTALELALNLVAVGFGGVVGRLLSRGLARIVVQTFTEKVTTRATENTINAVMKRAVLPAQSLVTSAALSSLQGIKNSVATALEKPGLLDAYVEAAGLQTLSEEESLLIGFNNQAREMTDLQLADSVLIYKALIEQLKADPELFLRELTIGFLKLQDESYLESKAEDYGGSRKRLYAESDTVHETEARMGRLIILGPFSAVGTWNDAKFQVDRAHASGINSTLAKELQGTAPAEMPFSLGFRFWGWMPGLLGGMAKVWFVRTPEPSSQIYVDLDESWERDSGKLDDGREWMARYFLQSDRSLSDDERNKYAAQGALKIYQEIKDKPVPHIFTD